MQGQKRVSKKAGEGVTGKAERKTEIGKLELLQLAEQLEEHASSEELVKKKILKDKNRESETGRKDKQ